MQAYSLREKIVQLVRSAAFPANDAVSELCDKTAEMVADRILAIPEIANGQQLLRAKMDELGGGMGFVKIERVDPADVYLEPEPPSDTLSDD